MSEHTPTPWEWDKRPPEWLVGPNDEPVIIPDEETIITDADREFIVRAVNAHDDMLEALKSVVKGSFRADSTGYQHLELDVMPVVKAAIAKAKGE